MLETVPTGDKKIRAMTPVGTVSNHTPSAQLETAPTKHREHRIGAVRNSAYQTPGAKVSIYFLNSP